MVSQGLRPIPLAGRGAAPISAWTAVERNNARCALVQSQSVASAATHDGSDHSLACVAVPSFRTRRSRRTLDLPQFLCYVGRMRNKTVRPFGDRDRPLSVGAHGEAWDSEHRGFFLETAGISDDCERMLDEIEHL